MSNDNFLTVVNNSDVTETSDQVQRENIARCYCIETKGVTLSDPLNLFEGFNSIKAVTFSYNVSFIDQLMKNFKYGEIIIGGNFMTEKDASMQSLLCEIHANCNDAVKAVRSYPDLVEMARSGDLELRTANFVLDHRKVYLLKNDDGRTRVIVGSANMTKSAWNGEHMETYEYDDSYYGYKVWESEFETAWDNSTDIMPCVISSKTDLINGNPILKGVKDKKKAIVINLIKDEEFDISITKYAIDHEKAKENFNQTLGKASKKGIWELNPEKVEKIESKYKSLIRKEKTKINIEQKDYPTLKFDYENCQMFLSDHSVDLNPAEEDVLEDIRNLNSIFDNYNEFYDNDGQLKQTHFKLMNAVFASPFIAKLRCEAFFHHIGTKSLPVFLLASSSSANSGKTFMVRILLKMMTGAVITPENRAQCKKENVAAMQMSGKGTPIFIDEIDNRFLSNIKDLIKNPETCERNQFDEQPLIIFASNDIIEPEEPIRKRLIFLRFNGALPSDIDQSAFASGGEKIIQRIGTAFYREYARRMIQEVKKLIDYMVYEKDIPDDWYPDLMNVSSRVILSVYQDYNCEIPDYMKELTWNNDYYGAICIAENTFREIHYEYQTNKKAFRFGRDKITIELGQDAKNRVQSWCNTLPKEMIISHSTTRDTVTLVLKLKEFEKHAGKLRRIRLR